MSGTASGLSTDNDTDAVTGNRLSGTDLGGFAAFRLPVNGNFAGGNHVLALSPAVGEPDKLEQITQTHILTAELKLATFHNNLLSVNQCDDTGIAVA